MGNRQTGGEAGEAPLARTATKVAGEASDVANHQASQTMDRAADVVTQVASAVRSAGEGLREQQPQLASFADTAARRVDETAQYLRDHEPSQVIGEVESWARRQPALALGGAALVGLIVGRFIRSASPPRSNGSGMPGSTGRSYHSDLGYGAGPYDPELNVGSAIGANDSGIRSGYGVGTGYLAGTGGDAISSDGLGAGARGMVDDLDEPGIVIDEVDLVVDETVPDRSIGTSRAMSGAEDR
jgi:hypothetical protein